MFSTRVTGLPSSPSGLASSIPLMPPWAVPSQYASTSSWVTPAEVNASPVASSEQVVEPLVPVLGEARAAHPDDGDAVLDPVATHQTQPCLPEVVVDAVGGEQLAERQLDPGADAHLRRRRRR